MNIAIVGYGSQGKSALEFFHNPEHKITVCDVNTELDLPKGVIAHIGGDYMRDLNTYDLVVRSPSIHPSELASVDPAKITTNTNEFLRACPTKNIIGVTGTKGKGTTSTLITEMLEAMGKIVHLGGNIGTPPLDLLKNKIKPDDWVVLELANFQLIDIRYSPKIAVCLMVEPEHLDWHDTFDEYLEAKKQLFMHQTVGGVAIYKADDPYSSQIASLSAGTKIGYMSKDGAHISNDSVLIDKQIICAITEIKLPGKHNLENICAALTTVWQIQKDADAIRKVLKSFSGLPFRIEPRGEKNGVKYYNDSFASAPGATIAAINAISGDKVLILGGYERGLDLSELIKTVRENDSNISRLLLIGSSAERLAEEFKANGFEKYTVCKCAEMDDIVSKATKLAKPGDSVVLSPGFPSFDMFKNFEDRGIQFNQAVERI